MGAADATDRRYNTRHGLPLRIDHIGPHTLLAASILVLLTVLNLNFLCQLGDYVVLSWLLRKYRQEID